MMKHIATKTIFQQINRNVLSTESEKKGGSDKLKTSRPYPTYPSLRSSSKPATMRDNALAFQSWSNHDLIYSEDYTYDK